MNLTVAVTFIAALVTFLAWWNGRLTRYILKRISEEASIGRADIREMLDDIREMLDDMREMLQKFSLEAAEDRKQAAEDRKQAAVDRKKWTEQITELHKILLKMEERSEERHQELLKK